MADDVILKVDGKQYGGWKRIDIRRSLDYAVDTFSLGITDRWGGETTPRPIRMGSACEIWIGAEKVITGYVDDVNHRYDANERSIDIEGRSKVADLVDCSYPIQLRAQTLEKIAAKLCEPFGIAVKTRVPTGAAFADQQADEGQPVFELLESLARQRAVRLVSDADGNLVITRASTEKLTGTIELGGNVRNGEARFSMRDRFKEYRLKGQRQDRSSAGGETSAHIKGIAVDLTVPRYRPTVLVAEEPVTLADAQRRAEWQRNVNYGRSMQATYTVTGWRHSEGLWAPNRLVRIFDEFIGLPGIWWMIATVRLVLDDQGMRTEITTMPKEAFDLIPLPTKENVG